MFECFTQSLTTEGNNHYWVLLTEFFNVKVVCLLNGFLLIKFDTSDRFLVVVVSRSDFVKGKLCGSVK